MVAVAFVVGGIAELVVVAETVDDVDVVALVVDDVDVVAVVDFVVDVVVGAVVDVDGGGRRIVFAVKIVELKTAFVVVHCVGKVGCHGNEQGWDLNNGTS